MSNVKRYRMMVTEDGDIYGYVGERAALDLYVSLNSEFVESAEHDKLEVALQHIVDGCRLFCEPNPVTTGYEQDAVDTIRATIDEAEAALEGKP